MPLGFGAVDAFIARRSPSYACYHAGLAGESVDKELGHVGSYLGACLGQREMPTRKPEVFDEALHLFRAGEFGALAKLLKRKNDWLYEYLIPRMQRGQVSPLKNFSRITTLSDILGGGQPVAARDLRVALAECIAPLIESPEFLLENRISKLVALVDALHAECNDSARSLRQAFARHIAATAGSRTCGQRIKIVYLAASAVPIRAANCVHVMKMCNAIARNGNDVILVARTSGEVPVSNELFSNFSVDEFDCELVGDIGSHKRVAIEQFCVGYQKGGTHFFGRSLVGCYAAALTGMPTCLEQHVPISEANKPIARELFRQPSFRGLIVVTNALLVFFREQYPDLAGKIHVVPDAADPPSPVNHEFDFASDQLGSLRVGYAGHLYAGKGAETILELAKRLPSVTFHLLGGSEGDLASWLRHSSGLRNVHFYGHRPHARVSAFLRGLDVGIAPYLRSVSCFQGTEVANWMSPLKLFEYMAHGLPIISSDLPVLREVLDNGRNAILCDPEDIDTWVAAVESLQCDKDLCHRLAQEAKQDFNKYYSWEKRASRALAPLLS